MKQNGLQQNEQPRRKSTALSNPAPLLMYLWKMVTSNEGLASNSQTISTMCCGTASRTSALCRAAGRILLNVLLRNPGTCGEGLGFFLASTKS